MISMTFFPEDQGRHRRNTDQLYVEYLVCVDYANFVM